MQLGQFRQDHVQVAQRWPGPPALISLGIREVLTRGNAAMRPLVALLTCAGLAVAQKDLKPYKTVVENAAGAPVVLMQFGDGPGFTVTNASQRVVTHVRFGCVAPGSLTGKTAKVRFDMGKDSLALDASGPRSQRTFEGYTPEQSICSHQGSAITILEVLFKGGKNWRLPHQVRDKDYADDRTGKGDTVIR